MKHIKVVTIVCLAVAAGVLAAGSSNEHGLPPNVASENWIPLGDNVGFVTGSVPQEPGAAVDVHLFVRTAKGWRRASIENNAYWSPVGPQDR